MRVLLLVLLTLFNKNLKTHNNSKGNSDIKILFDTSKSTFT